MRDILSNYHKIYIWGTGHNAQVFLDRLHVYMTAEGFSFGNNWEKHVSGFVDRNEIWPSVKSLGERVQIHEAHGTRRNSYELET